MRWRIFPDWETALQKVSTPRNFPSSKDKKEYIYNLYNRKKTKRAYNKSKNHESKKRSPSLEKVQLQSWTIGSPRWNWGEGRSHWEAWWTKCEQEMLKLNAIGYSIFFRSFYSLLLCFNQFSPCLIDAFHRKDPVSCSHHHL